jgi:hypothetical protein
MSVRDFVHEFIPVATAMAPYSWPITVLILVASFRNHIKEITEAKFGDKLYLKWGQVPSDLKFEEAIGETLPGPATNQLSVPSGVKWENVANLFWLGNDLEWTAQTLLRGAPKERILHGLTQCYHHISDIGLAESGPAKHLSLLKSEVASLPEAILDRQWRSIFSERLYVVIRAISDLLRGHQQDFRPGPER